MLQGERCLSRKLNRRRRIRNADRDSVREPERGATEGTGGGYGVSTWWLPICPIYRHLRADAEAIEIMLRVAKSGNPFRGSVSK